MRRLQRLWLLLVRCLLHPAEVAGVPGPNCLRTFASPAVRSGNFSSPAWPESYPENVRCRFQFRAAPGEVVWIRWTSFHLEGVHSKTQQCLRDYVEVIVTDHQNQQHVSGRFCGSQTPPEFKTMQQALDVIFQSSFTKHYQGFSGTFIFLSEADVEPPQSLYPGGVSAHAHGCGGFAQGDHGGVITNPGYPATFPSGVDCFWVIRVQPGKQIYIKLTQLELSDSIAECRLARLQVLDGYSPLDLRTEPKVAIDRLVDAQQLVQFCGQGEYYKEEGEKSYMSDRNRIIVRFATTAGPGKGPLERRSTYGNPIGFRLVWTEVHGTSVKGEEPDSGECGEFLCAGGEFCVAGTASICAERRRYCIHKSLVCDGVPHCAESDASDEENCYSFEIVGAGAGVFFALVFIILLVICCQRQRNIKELRSLEQRAAATDGGAPWAEGVPNGRNRGAHDKNHNTADGQPIKALPHNCHGYAASEAPESAPFLGHATPAPELSRPPQRTANPAHDSFDGLPQPPRQFQGEPKRPGSSSQTTMVHLAPCSSAERRAGFQRRPGPPSASSSFSHEPPPPPPEGEPASPPEVWEARDAFSEAWSSSSPRPPQPGPFSASGRLKPAPPPKKSSLAAAKAASLDSGGARNASHPADRHKDRHSSVEADRRHPSSDQERRHPSTDKEPRPILKGAVAGPLRTVAVPPSPDPQRKSVGFASPNEGKERSPSPWHHRTRPTQV